MAIDELQNEHKNKGTNEASYILEEIEVLGTLGVGGHGAVYEGLWQGTSYMVRRLTDARNYCCGTQGAPRRR